jgi:hypothetical protein
MEQTAVEILFKIWLKKEHITPNEWSEALEMEKQNIVDAWNDGLWGKIREGEDNAESYYNETFKSENITAIEKVDWFCPKCNSYVSSESVTFEETHQVCNTGVILKELN